MQTPQETETALIEILNTHCPPLQLRKDEPGVKEYAGTIPAMQGKQKVDGYYFASVMIKPKDCRLYFFPIYTHADHFADVSPEVRKMLKGKSCFHFKKLEESHLNEIASMVAKGVKLYQQDGVI